MKKFKSLFITIIVISLFFISCKSNNENPENVKLEQPNPEINNKIANDSLSDYTILKQATTSIILKNEQKISEFKDKLKIEKLVDQKKIQENINLLEAKNKELKSTLSDYKEQGKTQLETFKKRLQKSLDDVNKDIETYKKEHNY